VKVVVKFVFGLKTYKTSSFLFSLLPDYGNETGKKKMKNKLV